MKPQEASLTWKRFTGGGERTHVCLHVHMLDIPDPLFQAGISRLTDTMLPSPVPSSFPPKAHVLFLHHDFFSIPLSRFPLTSLYFDHDSPEVHI